jgi:hypothetical protein
MPEPPAMKIIGAVVPDNRKSPNGPLKRTFWPGWRYSKHQVVQIPLGTFRMIKSSNSGRAGSEAIE